MPQREDQNTTLGGLDPQIPKNEPLTADNAMTPDSMTPPSPAERERQKSYAQMRNERALGEREQAEEAARVKAEPKIGNGHLSVALQKQPVPVHRGPAGIRPSFQGELEQREGTATPFHLEDTELLPKFAVDDARKLKGGEGQQFRIDAVRMVEAETARVAQLHEIVGVSDIGLGCDGLITDPPNDFTALDQALAVAQEQIVQGEDEGDSDVKEIAIVSEALQQTARYWAIEVPEQAPPPDPEVLEGRRADESDDAWYRREEEFRDRRLAERQRQPAAQEPQWKTGDGN